ncbi:TniQ family protein [Deinococcus sp. SM5_A1]|uniref:TniQ family protein n=1 Tax=Deinococcus sp. SM5_A1 TaxID=3379094 RepID=UPI00385CDBA9
MSSGAQAGKKRSTPQDRQKPRIPRQSVSVGRRLRLRLTLIPGESFASFMDRQCAFQPPSLATTLTGLMVRSGLLPEEYFKHRLGGYGLLLSPEHLAQVADVTRTAEDDIRSSLLMSYAGTCLKAPDLSQQDPDFPRRVGHENWGVSVTGTHFAPCCLSAPAVEPWPDGDTKARAMLLRWKLAWTFVCLEHRQFLHGVCPRCGQRPGGSRADLGAMPRFASLPPRPGYCMNPRAREERGSGRASEPCGHDFTTTPTIRVTQRRLLNTQRTLNTLLGGQPLLLDGVMVAPLEVFGHLRSLVSLALHVSLPEDLGPLQDEVHDAFAEFAEQRTTTREERREQSQRGTPLHPYKAAPTDPLLMAATLPFALEVLQADGPEARAEMVTTLAARMREVKVGQAWQLMTYCHIEGLALDALSVHLTAKAQMPRRLGQHSHDRMTVAFTPDHVPAELWTREYERYFARFFKGSDLLERSARRFISMVLVQMAAPLDRPGAARALGLPESHAGGLYNKAMGVVNAAGHTQTFDATVRALAERLSAGADRIDYGARRRALAIFTEVPAGPFKARGGDFELHLSTAARRRNAAAWIWGHLTLCEPSLAPALQELDNQTSVQEVYRRFEKNLAPQARGVLEELAGSVLAGYLDQD